MKTRLVSSKAPTTTTFGKGPAASMEEMMMLLEPLGKRNKEAVRQLEVNDLVWIVDENVKRAHYKLGSDGSLSWKRWASEISTSEN